MTRPLRALQIEDSADDAFLVRRELARAGYDLSYEVVDGEASMRAALERGPWDVVLSDNSLPGFQAADALRLLKLRGHDAPFIVVSGSIGEATAVALMKAGAHDYVFKGNLARLVPAVEREMREAAGRAQRRRAEEALRESEARYRRFFEEDFTGVVLTTPQGAIVDANPAFLRMLGVGRLDEVRGTRMMTLYEDAADHDRILDALHAQGRLESCETGLRRPDGATVNVLATAVAVRDAFGELEGIETFLVDLTEHRRLEEQFRQAQKMEAMGRLAGGVAHDFNNLLVVINGYSEIGLTKLPEGHPVRKHLAAIADAGERAAVLTQQLLAFSRRQVVQPVVVDVGAAIRGVESLLRRLIGEDVRLVLELDPAAGHVRVDRGQLDQVLLNLAVNARDAMPRGGQLTIRASAHTVDAGSPALDPGIPPGRWVRVDVADTGEGMDETVKERLFEPFFTTKEVGKGTGLGLAIVQSVAAQSGGRVAFSSEVGKGTEFRLYLPLAEADADALPRAERVHERPGAGATVLVVEDDPATRALVGEVLRGAGYAVLEAQDGEDAIAVHGRAPRLDLVVTDVVMPRSNGPAMVERLRSGRPDLKVLYLSGYATEGLAEHALSAPGAAFLPKPFQPADLVRAVRESLGA